MIRPIYLVSTLFFLIGSVACTGASGDGSRVRGDGSGDGSGNGNGNGNGSGSGGTNLGDLGNGDGSSGDCGSLLPVTYRDFKGSGEPGGHPDFELSATKVHDGAPFEGWNDVGCELVNVAIGADHKPVFYSGPIEANDGVVVAPGSGRMQRVVNGPDCWSEQNPNPNPAGTCFIGVCQPWAYAGPGQGSFGEIQDASTFSQWYNDVPGVNITIEGELLLTETSPGVFVYDTDAFFPLDDVAESWGITPGQQHNYGFTTEIHVMFQYTGNQVFTFRGDDDLWIFVNGKLALDVGGLHQALTGTIDFDQKAAELGLELGSRYQMDIFHAERQTTASNFRIETNISCFEPVVVR